MFIAMLSNGIGEVAVRPELSAPQLFFHLWAESENFSGGETFYHGDNFCDSVYGNALDEKVNVILVCANF